MKNSLNSEKSLDSTFSVFFSVRNKGLFPSLHKEIKKIQGMILGSSYTLNLICIGDTISQKLNQQYRNKSYPTNVLAFPISKQEGEIFFNIRKAEREAKKNNIPQKDWLLYLFIHACLHLTGLDHGVSMEKKERLFIKKLSLNV